MASQAKRIGGDWVESTDPSTGKSYYANLVTKETRWDYPPELKGDTVVDDNWVAQYDPASGKTYYYHKVTKQTRWDNPNAPPEAKKPESPWKSTLDPASGKTYYYNRETRETRWTKPEELEDDSDDEEESKPSAPAGDRFQGGSSSARHMGFGDVAAPMMSSGPAADRVKALQAQLGPVAAVAPPQPPPPAGHPIQPPPPAGHPAQPLPPAGPLGGPPAPPPPPGHPQPPAPLSAAAPVAPPPPGPPPGRPSDMGRPSDLHQPPPPPNELLPPPNPQAAMPAPPPLSQLPLPSIGAPKNSELLDSSYRQSAIHEDVTMVPGAKASRSRASESNRSSDMSRSSEMRGTESSVRDESKSESKSGGRRTTSMRISHLKSVLEDDGVTGAARKPVHSHRFRVTLPGYDTANLVQQCAGFPIEQFAERKFNFNRKGILNSRTTMTKILSWKHDLISTSLMTMPSKLSTEAVQTFRNITGYMGDRPSSKSALDHVTKLMSMMFTEDRQLTDEVYCQIVKQTTNNPNENNLLRGWQLMAILLAAFPPSDELRMSLGNYISNNINSSNARIAACAEYCLHRMFKICELGRRTELPTIPEVQALARMRPMMVRVWLLDESFLNLPIESWTTASDLEQKIATKLGLRKTSPFCLFELRQGEEERPLGPNLRIMELLTNWNKRETEHAAKKTKQPYHPPHLVYKVRYFLDVDEDDGPGLELLYIQASFDVIDARYPCSEQDAVTLAALKVQEEFGDIPAGFTTVGHIHGKVHKYLSQKWLQGGNHDIRESQIIALYSKLAGYSKAEARLSYLDYVRSWKIYGSTYFFAQPQSGSLPREVVLAVNARGILLIDAHTKEFLSDIPYKSLSTWGHSPTSFVIVTGSDATQEKQYFNTEQGEAINNLVRVYVEAMVH